MLYYKAPLEKGKGSDIVRNCEEEATFCYVSVLKYVEFSLNTIGPGSVAGITTAYGLDGPEIEPRWGEIFRTGPDQPWGPPNLLYNGYRVFPVGKVLPGRDADTPHPLLVQRSKIE